MSNERTKDVEKILNGLYENWKYVREDTIENLGRTTALHIIDFHGNNWINITKWILSEYNRDEQINIVFTEFLMVFKEIYWLQFLFLNANYPMIYRNLRYLLEMIAQAYFIDNEYPELTIDEHIEKIKESEEKRIYGLKIVKPVLCKILNYSYKDFVEKFIPTWNYLNKHVHPSAKQMDMVVTEDIASLVTDSFNENLAGYSLEMVDEIFDIIYSIVFYKFSKIKELAIGYKFKNEWNEYLPYTMRIVETVK